jgi:nucleotide-binding universal stress UspA family protein
MESNLKPPSRILATVEARDHDAWVIDKVSWLRDHAHAHVVLARDLLDASSGRGQAWRQVIDAAHRYQCDLIIKDVHEDAGANDDIGDWELLIKADLPVMMVRSERWEPGAPVVAALDVFDARKSLLNRHVVCYAAALTELLDGRLHLVNALPSSSAVAFEYGITNFRGWLADIVRARRASLERLAEAADARVEGIHVPTGVPWQAVADTVGSLGAECLVIGQVLRTGQRYLDTTVERLLHTVASDVVSVP